MTQEAYRDDQPTNEIYGEMPWRSLLRAHEEDHRRFEREQRERREREEREEREREENVVDESEPDLF